MIFDLGGVVLDWVPERAFEQVMDAADVSQLMQRIGFREWNAANDGYTNLAGREAELVARFPADADAIRGYREHFLHSVTGTVPGTPAVIAELQQRGVAVSALTNWSGELFALTRSHFGVMDRFADIVVSGQVGVAKPDHRIFALACERGRLDPAETMFVDDAVANVDAASASGLHGLRFTTAEQLREDLVALDLLGPRPPIAEPVYHWALRTDWAAATATGAYPWSTRGVGFRGIGFVHCSFAAQADGVREEFYGDLGDDEVVLLRLSPSPDLPIVVEDGYPHLFEPLPVDRVVQVASPE